jgi:hypothetical protein
LDDENAEALSPSPVSAIAQLCTTISSRLSALREGITQQVQDCEAAVESTQVLIASLQQLLARPEAGAKP